MGERDPGLAPAAAAPPWAQRAVLAALLTALVAAAAILGPVEVRSPDHQPALVIALLELPLAVAAGAHGPAILGALLLALAALCACRPLERRIGPSAPLLVALLAFGSAAWALVWVDGRLLAPLALAAAAFALAYGGGHAEEPAQVFQAPAPGWRGAIRWTAVGLLLAELVPASPLLAGLVLPASLAVPRARRGRLVPLLLAGFAAGVALELWLRGPDLVTGLLRRVDETFQLDPALAGRSVVALVAGRNVGLLAGFAPALLLLILGRGARRPALAATALTLALLGALLLPFHFAGGWLNVSFLALYGALWHLPARPPRGWEWAAALALCGLVLWPLAVGPRAAVADRGVGLTAAWPRRHLPYEAALRDLPGRGFGRLRPGGEPGGVRFRAVSGCRLRDSGRSDSGSLDSGSLDSGPLDSGSSDYRGRFETVGGGPAEIWLAAPPGLEMVALELGPGAPSSFAVTGAEAGRTVFRPDGRVGFEVLLSEPRGEHRLWFGERPWTVHLIRVNLPVDEGAAPLRFRLVAGPQP